MEPLTKPEVQKIIDALRAASEHLDFCGYGDTYEREGAEAQKLPDKIEEALSLATKKGY